ncbi:LacI family DNA-binding transcriptional regulator [Microbacterium sp. M]|uniref:LacI family DNA-binding transcriptional regulator n=1 Tax=Microbacterium sp. M TaxID=3377125 RepID=UPI00386816B8
MTTQRTPARPSMADVGRLAKVSTQTVSRYFTGVGYVRAETRERIAAAIDELGYIPNLSARSLRTQRSNIVGVLSMGALNYGGAAVLTGLGQAAREAEVMLMISQLDLDFEAKNWEADARRAMDHFLSVQVDGVVLATPIPDVDRLLTGWNQATPVLTVSERPWTDESSASAHSRAAGAEATRYLIGLGHRRIVHIAGPATRNETFEREHGYLEAMAEAGLEPSVLSGATDWSPVAGRDAGLAIDPTSFTAAFAANDEIALGFMNALEERGLRAPDDYSIVGVDDMPTAAYFSPPLTSMRLDFRGLGAATFRMLHHQILTGEHAAHYELEPELVIRASAAAPAR